ncbi:MAG TPA: large conductance mechanosensitive channel protein MscL, partial [Vicinamibacterales bacterium]
MGGFKKFMMRGNVVDMAVGVIIGGAFGAVVASLTKDILTPFIALFVGKQDFSAIKLQIGSSAIGIGLFINAVIAFILVGAAVYLFVVLPMNAVTARMTTPAPPAAPTTKKCKECLSDI